MKRSKRMSVGRGLFGVNVDLTRGQLSAQAVALCGSSDVTVAQYLSALKRGR